VLCERASDLFKHATTSAAARADTPASTLRVGIVGIEIGVDVRIQVGAIRDEPWIAGIPSVTRLKLAWEATHATALFPSMQAR
jgi:hypothetical protein